MAIFVRAIGGNPDGAGIAAFLLCHQIFDEKFFRTPVVNFVFPEVPIFFKL
jgi:hypothetical protein